MLNTKDCFVSDNYKIKKFTGKLDREQEHFEKCYPSENPWVMQNKRKHFIYIHTYIHRYFR